MDPVKEALLFLLEKSHATLDPYGKQIVDALRARLMKAEEAVVGATHEAETRIEHVAGAIVNHVHETEHKAESVVHDIFKQLGIEKE